MALAFWNLYTPKVRLWRKKCLLIELRGVGLTAEAQKPIPVSYEGEIVGDFTADIVVGNKVIIEISCLRQIRLRRKGC